jgi:hypothetical protein
MKRVVLALVAVAVLCIAASQAQAAGVAVTVGGWGPSAHVVHHHPGWRRPVVVHPPVIYPPRVFVPATPTYVYPPVYSVPRVYYGGPSGSFYYSGPGVSVGVGF